MQMKDLAACFFPFLKIFQKSDCIPVLLFNDFVGYHASLTAQLLRASLLRMGSPPTKILVGIFDIGPLTQKIANFERTFFF